jgi:two-component sensor histidine kinase/PAS domain-containing protein
MIIQITGFAVAFAVATAICLALSLYVWQRHRTPGGTYFALFMASAALWALASALENSVADIPSKILFSKLSYLGVATVAPLWWLFALRYSRRSQWLESRWLPLIWAVPVTVILLAFTNEWHGLIWTSVTPASDVPGSTLIYAHGPAVLVNITYGYILMLGGSIILLYTAMQSLRQSRLPIVTMVLGILVALVTNVLYGTNLNPFTGLDITPLAFTVSGLLFTWAIFGQRLFDLVPVARETLIQVMADGAVVLDGDGRVVEINPAARRILGLPEAVTAPDIGAAADRWPVLAGCFGSTTDAEEEIMIPGPAGETWLEARTSILHDAGGRQAGRLVVLRDISNRKRAEEELKRSNEALKGEVAEKTRAQEALSVSLREKEVLLKEIHHRVKNNLQIISSLLSLQTTSSGREGAAEALRDSQNRIRSMALIHEKLYMSSDIAHVDFREYAETLARNLIRSYSTGPHVRMAVDIDLIPLGIDTAIPCGLIINELVSNALKYAFPGGRSGEIRIRLAYAGGTCTLTVSDDGAGLPDGFDFRNTSSLGLQLVNILAEQMEGTVELDTARGTTFKITFKDTK